MVIGCYYLTLMIIKNNFVTKNWFANEKQALTAFYQKKLTIHTPILVRYPSSNFKINVEGNKLKFIDTLTNLDINEKEIYVHKIFQIDSTAKKFYLISTIGILIAHYMNENTYEITDIFIETTPGRLIFSTNFKNAIGK